MMDLFAAKDPVISLLRLVAALMAVALPILVGRNELTGLVRKGWDLIREEARLSRTKTGYVAAVLGRNSTLLGACTFVFAVFRTEYFAAPAARTIAMILSSIAVVVGCFVGVMVIAITHEIVRQTRGDN